MNKPQITIKDIARALNVSPSTVSRALKDNPDISKETRDLVHAYAREHNYKPNVLAVNLRASRSNTTGVGVCLIIAAACKYGKGNTKKESQKLHVFHGVILIISANIII